MLDNSNSNMAKLVEVGGGEKSTLSVADDIRTMLQSPREAVVESRSQLLVVMVWVKAFIPMSVPGYTKPLPGSSTLTMIDDPLIPGCFITDNRYFSPDVDIPARMTSIAVIDVWHLTMQQLHYCDDTIRVDCSTGSVVCNKRASHSRMEFSQLRGQPGVGVEVDLKSAAANPCAFGSEVFGDLDYQGYFAINIPARQVLFNGLVEPFPAFEVYAKGFAEETSSDPPFIGTPLVQRMPIPGAGPSNIPGDPNQPVSGLVGL